MYKQLSVMEKSDRGVRSAAYESSSQANNLMMCPGENEHIELGILFFIFTLQYLCTCVHIYL